MCLCGLGSFLLSLSLLSPLVRFSARESLGLLYSGTCALQWTYCLTTCFSAREGSGVFSTLTLLTDPAEAANIIVSVPVRVLGSFLLLELGRGGMMIYSSWFQCP